DDRHRFPARDIKQPSIARVRSATEERFGGFHDVLHFCWCPPALAGSLLEQAEGVAIAMVEIAQGALLQSGGDRYDLTTRRDLQPLGHLDDLRGVSCLLLRQAELL